MKVFLVVFVALASVFGLTGYLLKSPFVSQAHDPNIEVAVSKENLINHVKALTGTEKPRSYQHIASLDSAADYIFKQLTASGYTAYEQSFLADGITYKNIGAMYGDPKLPRLVVGAHYDVCGDQQGADDNATGVSAMLELARLLNRSKPKLAYAIEFVAYTLEEPPYFRSQFMGSYVHAKSLHDNGTKVLGMVSLEMLGYYSDEPDSQSYPLPGLGIFYPDKGNFIAVVGKIGQGNFIGKFKRSMRKASETGVESIGAPGFVTGIDFSDHLNYWAFGYDAVMITDTSFFRNRNYHEKTDTIETLDFERMTDVVKGIYWAVVNL